MGSSIPGNWQSGVYKYDKRDPHFLFLQDQMAVPGSFPCHTPKNKTERSGSSLKRAARTQSTEPAPTMITSYLTPSSLSSNTFSSCSRCSGGNRIMLYQPRQSMIPGSLYRARLAFWKSRTTHGSSPSTQPSCPAGAIMRSPGPKSNLVPSFIWTAICPEMM